MRMFFLRRLPQVVARCLAVAALAAAGVSVSASSAHASSTTTCSGSAAISYSPGLLFTSQAVSWVVTSTYSSCTSTDTSLTAGSGTVSESGNASCTLPAGVLPEATYTIDWNNSQSSTMTLTVTDDIVGGTEVVTAAGTVTSGEFNGGAVVIVWVYNLVNPLQCLSSPGVTSQSGTVIAEIIVP